MSIRRQRDFMRIWSGQVASNIGDGVHRIALLWWASQTTESNLALVLVALASVVPTVLMAPLAGWLVDRLPRRGLMITSDAIRVATSATLALLYASGHLTTPTVVVIAAIAACAASVFDPSLMASVTMLVEPDQLTTANSMIGGAGAVAGIVGPALGGVLIGAAGTGAALWLDAGTFVVSLLLVAASRIPQPPAVETHEVTGGALAGWHLVRRDRSVRDLVVVASGLNFFAAPIGVLIVALAAGPLGLDGRGYGLLAACVPAGMLLGFLVAPRLAKFHNVALASLVITGGAMAAAGALALAGWTVAWMLIAGVGIGVTNAIIPSRFQAGVAPEVQGRVFALANALTQGGRPLGLLMAAPLLTGPGAQAGLVICGAGLAVVGLVGRRGLTVVPAAAAGALTSAEIAASPA